MNIHDLAVLIVAIEGPLHTDELVVRMRTVWSLQRAGQRIQGAVERAVAAAVASARVERRRQFLVIPGSVTEPCDRSGVLWQCLRRLMMLCPIEIDFQLSPSSARAGISNGTAFRQQVRLVKKVRRSRPDDRTSVVAGPA